MIEAFTARDKYSHALLFIKKFRDYKHGSADYKACVMMQIEKTMSLQEVDRGCTVHILKYLVAEDHLYVVMQHCPTSLSSLLHSQRVI